MKNLLIVESPAKAKTISKYLGRDFKVLASFGHIRDLPSKTGSVEPDKDFAMHYQVSPKSTKHVKAIVDAAKTCDNIYLAPDPDREGEAIAWHILEVLRKRKAIKNENNVYRVVFNAITKSSVVNAVANPRQLDMDLVQSQKARLALDYLVGFTLSPILWRKLPGSKSAGRVQSVALRILCDREEEIEKFVTREYWDIKLDLQTEKSEKFTAAITHVNEEKLAKFSITEEKAAESVKELLQDKNYQVIQINKKQTKRRAYPPFITSSLQQEAARKLGFGAKKTMTLAQKLYEGVEINGSNQGLITYMRTDSIAVSPEALKQTRDYILSKYGNDYLPASPNFFKSKVKNAQEAHEAIRPVDATVEPADVKNFLDSDQFKLYDLIFKRMTASQMSDVIFDQVAAIIKTIPDYALAKATGSTIKFDGFYKVYNEDKDDGDVDENDGKSILPELSEDQNLDLLEVKPNQHFTDPPPRFSEASLVKKLEELGIGRPSTYASIISVLQDRGYVRVESRRFFPEERGRIVTTFLKEFFAKYVEYGYTASVEDELDIVSNGDMEWKTFLSNFWNNFHANIKVVEEKPFPDVLEILNGIIGAQVLGVDEDGKLKDKCPTCGEGTLGLRLGKFGSFIGCSRYPDCKHTMQIFGQEGVDGDESAKKAAFEPRSLGLDPKTGCEIEVKIGPYGPYLELVGSDKLPPDPDKPKRGRKATKPKRIALPKNIDPAMVEHHQAVKLLSLPRHVGDHPETGKKITASIGPYGPYLAHDGKYASLKEDDVLEVGINRAVDLIEEAKNKPKRGGGRKKATKKKASKKK